MRLLLLFLSAVLLGTWHRGLAQDFSGYAGNCLNPGFAAGFGWDTVVTGFNCGPKSGSVPPVEVRLSLDNCLTFVDGSLVGGQG